MRCCKTKGNIIIPPIVIMPQAPPLQRQVIPSPCPPAEIPYYIPVNNCNGPRIRPRRLSRPISPRQYPPRPPRPTSPRQYPLQRQPPRQARPPLRPPNNKSPPPPPAGPMGSDLYDTFEDDYY